ncbi:Nif11-like leader peptide family natural product precursor [Anabaena sp. FACHB-709]|uniref:Nif11 domain-containing protein n=2 Tax=Nostocaceae TaxID=1162 RepID=A0A1Z4KNS7_ANAVA|nr:MULTISPECIES: Nif11-like leader peptide family natural product precursor [Nostocaceae]BAY70645.1 hypothetical protein NIES23_34520 [Trichormus variabilis NIES-23]HBW31877.1 hypothetical protein [Nostoc sp. UBA8866]MBD2172611.1 hypothetical protein [Anabaena cylindrica FACHB-318]MBD2264417.1 hypothetical protein [Anabaena sp. FACHB-709]MBD2274188.1 hypothetical protein [Nostoc sp. PCC 7120 = FACHB-418]
MSLQQANAFYEALMADEIIYEKYFNKCCSRSLLGSYHWDKTKIVNFAATLGYRFTETELAQLWFDSEPSNHEQLSLA